MKEIDLQLITKHVGGLTINDMVKEFGWRIKRAVYYDEDGNPKGLISVKMVKLMRWWKFWNKDIRIAYKKYTGLILVPWTVVYGVPEVYCDDSIDWNEMRKILLDEMKKYSDVTVDPKFYEKMDGSNPIKDCPIINIKK